MKKKYNISLLLIAIVLAATVYNVGNIYPSSEISNSYSLNDYFRTVLADPENGSGEPKSCFKTTVLDCGVITWGERIICDRTGDYVEGATCTEVYCSWKPDKKITC